MSILIKLTVSGISGNYGSNNSDDDKDNNNNSSSKRQNGSAGWGRLTAIVLAGMLLVSTLIIGISLPLSSSSSLSSTLNNGVAGKTVTRTASVAAEELVANGKMNIKNDNNNSFELTGNPTSPDGIIKEITLVAQDAELEIAPGKVVKTWTFNGTVPGPTLRFTEGDNVRIKFINKTPIPHTLHLHGNHDDVNDGVHPQIMPNESYIYNITAGPAGALMYHCHAHPTSLHIRMGMYGAMIIDPPKTKPLEPAREFVLVMSEYDSKDIMKFEAEYYPINGYADQYMKNPLQAMDGELVRMYVINIGTTIPYQFHLHSTIFKAYPSGLLSNTPIDAQTIPVGPGDATIVEAKWKYPGAYLFHSHGMQEERGNMGEIQILDNATSMTTTADINKTSLTPSNTINATTTFSTGKSISMIDWQYELQKKLQKPTIINYTDQELGGGKAGTITSSTTTGAEGHGSNHDASTTQSNTNNHGKTSTDANDTRSSSGINANDSSSSAPESANEQTVTIVSGASNPNNGISYSPSTLTVKSGSTIVWSNDDSIMHTATSGTPELGPSGVFNTGIINGPGKTMEVTINAKPGSYDYYCTLHPYMKGQLIVAE
jgi:nitrite reductase (NO-forming)